jgi:hypothetical protein
LLNLSAESFAKVVDSAFEKQLVPSFDPYRSGVNFLLSSYLIPYVGLTGYVGASPKLQDPKSKRVSLKFNNQLQPYKSESYIL